MRYAITLALGAVLLAGSVLAGPELTIPHTSFDFGYMPQHAVATHKYELRSTGDAELIITQIKPGCGCTKTPLEKNTLAPGEATELELVFDSKRFRGPVTKAARIFSNEGREHQLIDFTANILIRPDSTWPVIVTPYKMNMSQLGSSPRTEAEFTLTNLSENDLSPALITAADDYISVTLPEVIAAGQSATGRVQLTDAAVKMEFEKSFTFELDDGGRTRFTVPVTRTLFGSDKQAAGQASAGTQ
ncbi:DUF1573 domain-containing protein [candidate division GN15 bacterium]|nr:DUF1573 domain-containing protein [candidate division GN15 bacterium]